MRSRICELRSIGWGAKRIHTKHPNVPLGTIRYTIKKESERVDNQTLPRSGRPRQLTEEQKNLLYELSVTKPETKMRDMVAAVDGAVKERSIRRLLQEMRQAAHETKNRPSPTEEKEPGPSGGDGEEALLPATSKNSSTGLEEH